MRRTWLFLVASSCVWAQGFLVESYITADFGTGQLGAYGATGVYLPGEDFATAMVQTQISSGGYGFAQDNCGQGCATTIAYGQVDALGKSFNEVSGHFGEVIALDQDYQLSVTTQDWVDIPGAPSIYLQSINAQEPPSSRLELYQLWSSAIYTNLHTRLDLSHFQRQRLSRRSKRVSLWKQQCELCWLRLRHSDSRTCLSSEPYRQAR